MSELPPPTDRELLLAFVDDEPSRATQDYVRRTGVDYQLLWNGTIRQHFEQEWEERMAQP